MNVQNAPNGMNVNREKRGKRKGKREKFLLSNPFTLFSLLLLFLPSSAYAQGAAPAMTGVQEVIVQYTHFAIPKNSGLCGLEREAIAETLNKSMTFNMVPAFPVASAKPPMMGTARIELVPEIHTVATQTLDCTSWVSLTAQTQSNVHIAPVDVLRNVKIVYWQQGALVSSSQSMHAGQVAELLTKMAQQFAQQYRMDQPPSLPAGPSK